MSKVYLMTGIIASGKSTWAKDHVDSNTYIVSKDNIREMLYGKYDYKTSDEVLIDNISRAIIGTLIQDGCNVIIDECWDTMTCGARERLSDWCKSYGTTDIEIVYCSSIIGNVDRQMNSKGGTWTMWKNVYDRMLKEFEPPTHCLEEVKIEA